MNELEIRKNRNELEIRKKLKIYLMRLITKNI